MATTVTTNLIIPEVLADYVEQKLTDNSVFAPLAEVDNTLVGNAGDTLSFPKYSYIGKATVVAENGQIVPAELNADKVDKKVHKLAKAVQITDEAILSAKGNPMEEAAMQVVKAIDDARDDEFLAEMEGAPLSIGFTDGLSSDNIIDALELFGEDIDGQKALCVAPKDLASLRKDSDYINGSEIATAEMIRGGVGSIWGCQIIPSNRLKGVNERSAYIVKPTALADVRKRDILIEVDREPEYQRQTVYATEHSVAYRKNDSKIIRIRLFSGLNKVDNGIITSVAGAAQNGTIIKIGEAAPVNFKWVYKLGSADVTPTYGTALTGYTDWVDGETEIAASTSTKACVALVDKDNKPVRYFNVTLVKGA